MEKKRFLVAGATGYLGQYIVKELKKQGHFVRVIIREEKQKKLFSNVDEFFIAEVTKPKTLNNIANNIDYIFSSIGITRQKDGLTYMDVDYQGNKNLLNEAIKSNIIKFEYISAIDGDKFRDLKIFEAKEKFVDELKKSPLKYSIIRPNGFFSDMKDFLNMAKNGKVYLFSHGEYKLNPIHGEDLAKFCINKLISNENEEEQVGGPDILTQNEIAKLALKAWNKDIKIIHLPDFIRVLIIKLLRIFTSSKVYGPIEFFLTLLAKDNIASTYGDKRLEDFFLEEAKESRN
ncbi:NmrA family protein [Malaciobacter molluscorum LMG 25693]|uniref:NAD(P)-dependent oxidoreductase n=1 Tax=Malaciobacter molluscorum LMG 25693 TaxID=870501 RepID=A0A2G1DHC0_9BACT|nr:SDR family oxidoreductase [Malaciobacter molluscorum]AXX92279.1 NAD(P)-dependent oxidoreductase [Malaciobacter molluscorum LMG 25693]PHO17736.1 NmrA family protein [Malaciobacter molluscorum LMG 25693]